MDVAQLNQVNVSNAVEPNYTPKNMDQKIELYFSLDEKIIIVGSADNNYIYWLSHTSVQDKETNAAIFNYVANTPYKILTYLYKALQNTEITYESFQKMYHTYLSRTYEPNMEWKTPFGHYYGSSQIKNNGKFFANDLVSLPAKLREQCKAREADGKYIHVLQWYQELLNKRSNDEIADYYAAKPIIDILQMEKYLMFSQDVSVRNLYNDLYSQCSSLYNAYMTKVR